MIRKEISQTLKLISLIVGIFAGVVTIISVIPHKKSSIDLSGYWELTFNVKKSSLEKYDNGNLKYKYRIVFTQKDNDIKGEGEKFWENFKGVETFYNLKQKTPIIITGKIENNQLKANILEKGAKRETTGFIEFEIKKDLMKIEGKFKTTAANSSGLALLEKIND